MKTLIIAAMIFFAGLAAAAEIPQTITVTIPFAAGSSTDNAFRPIGVELEKRNFKVIRDYRPGAGGVVAMNYFKKQVNDGSRIMFTGTGNLVGAVLTHKDIIEYDIGDFEFITSASTFYFGILGNPSKSTDLTAFIKDMGKLGNTSNGQLLYINRLAKATNAKPQVIHYKNVGQLLTDVMGGYIDYTFLPMEAVSPFYNETPKRLNVIGITCEKRLPQFADIPCVNELVKGYVVDGTRGIILPKGASPEILASYTKLMKEILATADVKEYYRKNYLYMDEKDFGSKALIQHILDGRKQYLK